MRTRHTRKESRLAVYRVLLDIYQNKVSGKKTNLADLCARYHCGSINGKIIEAMDWGKMPVYEDAIIVLAANNDYKRSCNHGTRKTAGQALEDARSSEIHTTLGELKEASDIASKVTNDKNVTLSPNFDLKPDKHSLFPEQSLVPKAIKICQEAGYIVSRPL